MQPGLADAPMAWYPPPVVGAPEEEKVYVNMLPKWYALVIYTPSGAIVKQISSLPSDVHKTKKLSFDEYMNISKGHQILM